MRILIITQKVNIDDPVLGFFHNWIKEFAKHSDNVSVICLEAGNHDLPQNVSVYSLGKENGESRLKYVINFYKYIWSLRGGYDQVFVHMNEEYVLLGGLFWKILGKKVAMWRNHHSGSFFTNIAVWLCDIVFCTSKFSYTSKFKKTVLMPVGIDDSVFKEDKSITRAPGSILFLSRIAPSKRPHLLLEVLQMLKAEGMQVSATFVGDALPKDEEYLKGLKSDSENKGLTNVEFRSGVRNIDTVRIYNAHEICVNLSSSGMYDKTIFESALCGCLAVSSNQNLLNQFPDELIFEENNALSLANKLKHLLLLSSEQKELIKKSEKDFINKHHTLTKLGYSITEYLKN